MLILIKAAPFVLLLLSAIFFCTVIYTSWRNLKAFERKMRQRQENPEKTSIPSRHQQQGAANYLSAIFATIDVIPSEEELEFVINVIGGGKTDNAERAYTICAYFDKTGHEHKVFEILENRTM